MLLVDSNAPEERQQAILDEVEGMVGNGGTITSSDGSTSATKTWGQPAAWCAYSGTVNGRRAGVKIIPDPANFRPCWWHNRDYGVFVANPYGRAAMKQGEPSRVEVKRGESHRLRFTVVLHSSP